MTDYQKSYRTPLGKARGLGASHSGSHEWWLQRVLSVILIPLTLWLAVSIACLPELDYAEVINWARSPWNTVPLISFILLSSLHSAYGLQEIIKDYVHHTGWKIALKLMVITGFPFMALLALLATIRIYYPVTNG